VKLRVTAFQCAPVHIGRVPVGATASAVHRSAALNLLAQHRYGRLGAAPIAVGPFPAPVARPGSATVPGGAPFGPIRGQSLNLCRHAYRRWPFSGLQWRPGSASAVASGKVISGKNTRVQTGGV